METILIAFFVVWIISAVGSVFYLATGIKKINRLFEGISIKSPMFQERMCSGYSNKSIFTRLGGARNVLEVTVTESELYIKGIMAIFTFIGTKFDLTHRVPISNIIEAKEINGKVELQFRTNKGVITHIVLLLKNPGSFLNALKIATC